MRAGISLDLNDLKKVGRPAVLMCFLPACFEILGMASGENIGKELGIR